MEPTKTIIPQNGLLRKEHYLAGFLCQMDDDVTVITQHGIKVLGPYGRNTPMEDIHHDIDQIVERRKLFGVEAVTVAERVPLDTDTRRAICVCPRCGKETARYFLADSPAGREGVHWIIACECGLTFEALMAGGRVTAEEAR